MCTVCANRAAAMTATRRVRILRQRDVCVRCLARQRQKNYKLCHICRVHQHKYRAIEYEVRRRKNPALMALGKMSDSEFAALAKEHGIGSRKKKK